MGIVSLLDNDFYTFTQAQVVLHQYPGAWVKYKFKCRNNNGRTLPRNIKASEYLSQLNYELDLLCDLRISKGELEFLSTIKFFSPDYIEYLRLLKLRRDYIHVEMDRLRRLSITVEGPWISTIWFEVPVLAIVSELYSKYCNPGRYPWDFEDGRNKLLKKIGFYQRSIPADIFTKFKFADFGTRRRYSWSWQHDLLDYLRCACPDNFVGTSNVFFAKKLGVKPIGTMSHQFIQAHQQLGASLVDSQKAALMSWCKEYQGELGIALTDTVGFDAFLRDFNLLFAKLFDGCRHDSGDPVWWLKKLINHYIDLGIDPKTKTAVFSDGLTFETAVELFNRFHDFMNISFGIGTNLTNDLDLEPLQIVIKMVECNHQPVAKISDSKGKGMCEDKEYLHYLKKVFQIKEE